MAHLVGMGSQVPDSPSTVSQRSVNPPIQGPAVTCLSNGETCFGTPYSWSSHPKYTVSILSLPVLFLLETPPSVLITFLVTKTLPDTHGLINKGGRFVLAHSLQLFQSG